MYVNKCIKCGVEFETKNPKRVICPNCLYPDKSMMPSSGDSGQQQEHQHQDQQDNQNNQEQQIYNSENGSYTSGGYSSSGYSANGYSAGGYSAGGYSAGGYDRPQRNIYDRNQGGYQSRGGYQQRGGYDRNQGGYQQRGGYDRSQGAYQQRGGYNRNQGGYQQRGGYDRSQGAYQQRGGYDRNQGGYQQRRPQQGGYQQRRPQGGYQQRRPMGSGRSQKPQKQLLINKEQLEQIEALYKAMLPLPNPDAHEVIGEKIGLEPRKVFFGINLVRQKMMLPKLPFPKRKLAISPDQLMAIRSLYEPLLPLPPIGCHKIIAVQLKMDEWRVHVGIGLIRAQMGLDRWNPDRDDAPEEFKNQKKDAEITEEKPKKTRAKKAKDEDKVTEVEEKPKKTTRVKKVKEVIEVEATEEKSEKKTRGRKPKKVEDAE